MNDTANDAKPRTGMTPERLFQPKYFVWFCGLFLLVFGALQYVADARLKAEAQRWGTYVFNWDWPGSRWRSQTRIVQADVINKDEHDATVRVKGEQMLWLDSGSQSKTVACTALLKLYRRGTERGDVWELGEVQFP